MFKTAKMQDFMLLRNSFKMDNTGAPVRFYLNYLAENVNIRHLRDVVIVVLNMYIYVIRSSIYLVYYQL